MLKKIPKIITTIFLVVFLFQLIGFIFILTTPKISQAIEAPKLQVPIGEEFSKVNADDETISVPWIGEYISAVYKYAVGIVGILATVVMMFGGVLWITAGGNQERISNAKSWITASLTGLVLVLCSYLILSTVNPDLTRFKPIEINVVQKPPEIGCCEKIKDSGKGGDTTKDKCKTGWKGEKYTWDTVDKKCNICEWTIVGVAGTNNTCEQAGKVNGTNCKGPQYISIAEKKEVLKKCCCFK